MVAFKLSLHAGIKRLDILPIRDRIEAQHRFLVRDFGEFIDRRRPDSLSRRVAGDEIGMLALEFDEFTKQAIIFRVGYFRTVLTVVQMVVVPDFPAKGGNPLFGLAVRHGLVTHE